MAIKKSQLYTKLWQACDELRGGMDASQYKDYVLVVLFIKYISDRAKNGDADLYIDLPQGCTFDDLVALKGRPDIGEKMNVILSRIGEANEQLADTITNADFADEQKLGKGKDLVETVSNLIAVFQDEALDLSNNRAADDDLIGDAYEYLMKNFATQSGKSKGQFYTPGEVSRVMAKVVDIANDSRPMISIYDMTCGSGSLLIRAAAESGRPFDKIAIEGQELDLATIGMAKMSMVIHGIDDAELKHGNTISDPQHTIDDSHLKTFDYGFANPPFSVKGWMKGASENDPFGRWGVGDGVAPVPPPKCGDYAFLLHMIASLKSNGKGAIILPHGVLFRGNAEGEIRRFIIGKRIIRGIIGLPPNLFFGTGIPACIIILDKGGALSSKGIFMIDAKEGFAKDGAKNRLRECDIRRIVDTWEAQVDVPHYARMVSYEEIEKNDFNLNIPRYIAPVDSEIHQDIVAHLKGGIPEADAAAYPAALFKPLRKGYVGIRNEGEGIRNEELGTRNEELGMRNEELGMRNEELGMRNEERGIRNEELGMRSEELGAMISRNLESDEGIKEASKLFERMCNGWLDYFKSSAEVLARGNKPKNVILQWSEELMLNVSFGMMKSEGAEKLNSSFRIPNSSFAYAIYEHLMNYWAETLQDDCYLISRDGWKVELLPPARKNATWENYVCDLLPVEVVANVRFKDEKGYIALKKTELEEVAANIAEIDEKLGDEEIGEDIDEDALKEERKSLEQKAKKLKKVIKEATEKLTGSLLAYYAELDEKSVKSHVIRDKWITALAERFAAELTRVKAVIVSDVQTLASRYAETLPDAEAKVLELEKKVASHLAAMGIGN